MRSSRGHIKEQSKGVWRVWVSAGRNPDTGKRVFLTKTVRGSKRDAERVKEELLIRAGESSAVSGRVTLREFWERFYLPDVEARLRPVTINGYAAHYRQFMKESLETVRIADITPLLVQTWLYTIEGDKRRFEAFRLLRQILNKAVKLDLLQSNPCDRVEAPAKAGDYEPEILSPDDVAEYVAAFRGSPVEAAVLIAIGAGLRRSEVVALDWDDIEDGFVTVERAVTSVAGKAWEDDPKSRFGRRVVALPRSVAERLEELRGVGPLVQMTAGVRINPDNLSREYRKVQRTLPDGVRRVPFKNLRHTSLSLAVDAGADVLAVSRRAGHSNVGVTSRYYLRPSREIDVSTADALDSLLSSSASKQR